VINSIFVVIVHYKQEDSLVTSLNNLIEFVPKEKICIVDNSQTFRGFSSTEYIPLANPGFAAAMNIGVRHMKRKHPETQFAWLLSHETILDEKSLTYMIEQLESNRELVAVGPVLYLKSGTPWSFGGTFNPRGMHPKNLKNKSVSKYVDWLDGSCVLVDVEDFLSLGGYPEVYFLYMEDVAFGYIARNSGKQLLVCLDSFAEQQSSGTPRYLAIRNSLILSRNFRSIFHTLLLALESLLSIFKSLLWLDLSSARERIMALRDAMKILRNQKKVNK